MAQSHTHDNKALPSCRNHASALEFIKPDASQYTLKKRLQKSFQAIFVKPPSACNTHEEKNQAALAGLKRAKTVLMAPCWQVSQAAGRWWRSCVVLCHTFPPEYLACFDEPRPCQVTRPTKLTL
ncbi:hypothetical protein CEXT_237911 [Caerostris extrusa]|uniref:Uncharacterized protein n=1 Tax=Caerostris extrusa TaxID=172846 RepID=A0AAV4XCJ1_CAEEX|nr:hypothetical protein CEXT_237911 [Caerostris extrusa]